MRDQRMNTARRLAVPGTAAAVLLMPSAADAHGLVQRADLPIPEWLFGWAATIVLIASFIGLAFLWPQVRLERPSWRPLPGGRRIASAPVQAVAGLIGVALLAVVIWSGFAGEQNGQANFSSTFVYVIFWVGPVFLSLLFGDVFRALNPWRAVGRMTGTLVRRSRGAETSHRMYPERLGRWPAALFLLIFTWTELVGQYGDLPQRIAICAVLYSAITWAGMAVYGVERWLDRGEAFGIYFTLFSRISIFETRHGVVGRRPLLGGLTTMNVLPGTVAFVAVMIGTVTFDGLSQGSIWRTGLAPSLTDVFDGLGFSPGTAVDLAGTVGLILGPLLIGGFYLLGIEGAKSVGGGMTSERLRRAFVHSLIPIAMVYVMAHYTTLLVFQGQAIKYLVSDPLGHGWDLFGSASASIDYGVLSQTATWYLQVGFVVLGHVGALVLAHDRALALYRKPVHAVRSQYWMLVIMVGFTSLALWLLSQANV